MRGHQIRIFAKLFVKRPKFVRLCARKNLNGLRAKPRLRSLMMKSLLFPGALHRAEKRRGAGLDSDRGEPTEAAYQLRLPRSTASLT